MAEMTLGGGSWLTRALADDGATRVLVAETDEIAESLREAHGLTGASARLAAEAAVATVLLAAYVKGDEKLTLQVVLDRPEARYIGELDPDHRFRGRLDPADLPDNLDIRTLHGLLFAAKHDGTREVYRGITPVDGTSVTGALRAHLVESSQVSGQLATAVRLDEDGRVAFAGGVLVERLPPAPGQPSLLPDAFLERYGDLPDADVEALVAETRRDRLLGGALHTLEQRPIFWACTCSMERVVGALAGMQPEELRAMADEDDGASVDCHFCGAHYAVSADQLRELAAAQE